MTVPLWLIVVGGLFTTSGWLLFLWKHIHVKKALAHAERSEAVNEKLRKTLQTNAKEMVKQDEFYKELQAQWDSVPDELRREIVSTRAKELVAREIARGIERREQKNNK